MSSHGIYPCTLEKNDLFYFGQPSAIWECLFRSMRHFDFVALHDLDEFIVPVRHENITALLGTFIRKTIVDTGLKASFLDPSTDQNGSHLISAS